MLCFLFSLILSPSLWLSWAPCSEATPTAGTVPAAEVTGMAWGTQVEPSLARAKKEGEARGESMLQAHPFSAWQARLSRRMCVEDGTRGHQTHFPPFATEGGWHRRGPALTGSRPVLWSCVIAPPESPEPLPGLDTSEPRERAHSLWVAHCALEGVGAAGSRPLVRLPPPGRVACG